MTRRSTDVQLRFAKLLGSLVGPTAAITVEGLVDRMDLKTTVRKSVRRQYIEQYLKGTRKIESVWAKQIGDAIPRPWCSGAWGLWAAGCFEDFLWLFQLAVELTNDEWLAVRVWQLWHFMDALYIVCEPLACDENPVVRAINGGRDMTLGEFSVRDIFDALDKDRGRDPAESAKNTYDVFLRQAAKMRLRDVTLEVYAFLDLHWSPIEDPKYQRFYKDEQSRRVITDDMKQQLRVPPEPGVSYPLDRFADPFLESAHERARSSGNAAKRARLIQNDVIHWLGTLHNRLGGDIAPQSIDCEELRHDFFHHLLGECVYEVLGLVGDCEFGANAKRTDA